MQKYFIRSKEDHSQKSDSGHYWGSLISLAVETLGYLKYLPFPKKIDFHSMDKCTNTIFSEENWIFAVKAVRDLNLYN